MWPPPGCVTGTETVRTAVTRGTVSLATSNVTRPLASSAGTPPASPLTASVMASKTVRGRKMKLTVITLSIDVTWTMAAVSRSVSPLGPPGTVSAGLAISFSPISPVKVTGNSNSRLYKNV